MWAHRPHVNEKKLVHHLGLEGIRIISVRPDLFPDSDSFGRIYIRKFSNSDIFLYENKYDICDIHRSQILSGIFHRISDLHIKPTSQPKPKRRQIRFLGKNELRIEFYDTKWTHIKSYQKQSCRTHWDLPILFWSFLHPSLIELYKIWILKYKKFKYFFRVLNDFKWKNCQKQSCITYQDL